MFSESHDCRFCTNYIYEWKLILWASLAEPVIISLSCVPYMYLQKTGVVASKANRHEMLFCWILQNKLIHSAVLRDSYSLALKYLAASLQLFRGSTRCFSIGNCNYIKWPWGDTKISWDSCQLQVTGISRAVSYHWPAYYMSAINSVPPCSF